MFLAIYRNGDTPVVCWPPVKKLGGAIAVLKSRKRADKEGYVYSGDLPAIQRLAKLVHHAEWSGDISQGVSELAARCSCSRVPFDGTSDYAGAYTMCMVLATTHVTSTRKIPEPKMYPKYINPRAKKIWDRALDKHADVIDRIPDTREKWGAAIFIFKRYAVDEGVEPFTRSPHEKTRKLARTEINRRANRGNAAAIKLINKVFTGMSKGGLVVDIGDEKFKEAVQDHGIYYITTQVRVRLSRGVQPGDALRWLLQNGWGGQPGRYAHYAVDDYTDVMAAPLGRGIVFYMGTGLTSDQVTLLFDLSEDESKASILKLLGKAGRRWVKTGTLI